MKLKTLLQYLILISSFLISFNSIAESVDMNEQNNLGNKYRYEQDYVQAVSWYKKAALQGSDKAQNNLGNRYRKGQGVEQDYEKAVYWYTKAALQGNDKAQNNLGNMYRKAQGVERDYEQGVYWYKKSAIQGNDKAQNNLGNRYRKGQGVERDMNKAAYWIKKAKKQENTKAARNWNKHKLWKYENGNSEEKASSAIKEIFKNSVTKSEELNYRGVSNTSVLSESMNNTKLKEALRHKFSIGRRNAKNSDGDIGKEYYEKAKDFFDDKKYYKAYEWAKKSADLGYKGGYFGLGLAYEKGYGVEDRDKKKAMEWFRKAAKKGHTRAQIKLANLVRFDNPDEAVMWLKKAAEKNHFTALNNLGYMYSKGFGVQRNSQEAVKWYTKSAELGNKFGQYNMCRAYHLGKGISMNREKSVKWCKRSADQGYSDAKRLLEKIESW